MDDIVKAALKKWPNVPHCYDWLALDARGDWYMRDDRIQHAGPFPQVKGSKIIHDKLKAFIERNYLCDEAGQWFFQNGPQRVYLTLEITPWVVRIRRQEGAALSDVSDALQGFVLETHTGEPITQVRETLIDELGRLYVVSEHGPGLVHSMDMLAASDALDILGWVPEEVSSQTLPARYGYVIRPLPSSMPSVH
jgi:hypothetical protein